LNLISSTRLHGSSLLHSTKRTGQVIILQDLPKDGIKKVKELKIHLLLIYQSQDKVGKFEKEDNIILHTLYPKYPYHHPKIF
jgi:RNA:NAD 2'-phosphotransferase (TPT1/KptA family)